MLVGEPITLVLKPYIQPFERDLAFAEAQKFLGVSLPDEAIGFGGYSYQIHRPPDARIKQFLAKSAYWLSVAASSLHPTRQSIWEASTEVGKANGSITIDPTFSVERAIDLAPSRRCLRYGVHGIHQYRGKYFPQLVRSLINISVGNAQKRTVLVLDPMIGSGTTAVEAVALGYDCIGFDINPLSVFMAHTKTALLALTYKIFVTEYEYFVSHFALAKRRRRLDMEYLDQYSTEDVMYLYRWFPKKALEEIGGVLSLIRSVRNEPVKKLLLTTLSSILRSVSYQKEDDLRIRRTERVLSRLDVYSKFEDQLKRNASAISAFLYFKGDCLFGNARIAEGDARNWRSWGVEPNSIDCVMTSPPYATALPYIDTDRLSLILFGLVRKRDLRNRDYTMIGNREVTELIRQKIWENYGKNRDSLPRSVVRLIGAIRKENEKNAVGFRRRNMPYLLAKYFLDMKEVLTSLHYVMRRRTDAFLVVGDNRMTSGAKNFEIRSTQYLREIAQMVGFEWVKTTPMEMLVSRDIHRDNALKSESIIWLRK